MKGGISLPILTEPISLDHVFRIKIDIKQTTNPLAFPLAKSESLTKWGYRNTLAFHLSLKRNVYLNQINIQRETSGLRYFACKICCLHSDAFPQRHFCFLFCLLQQRQGGKCIPVLKSNKSSLLFRVLNKIKHPSLFLRLSPENKKKKAEIPTTPLHHLQNATFISFASSH